MHLLRAALPFLECLWIDPQTQLLPLFIICYQLSTQLSTIVHYLNHSTHTKITFHSYLAQKDGNKPVFGHFIIKIQTMLNSQKLFHIVIPLFLSVLYSGFIIQLQHPSETIFLYLGLYFSLFLIYTLKTYSIFHYPPSQPNYHSVRFDANLIFKYKLVQERRAEVEYQLGQKKKENHQLLERQYTKLLKSASFCDVCQKVQPPRSYHCYLCDVCIIKKHFHSYAIGFCIGQNNEKPYLLYLLISKFISLYAFLSLIVNQLTNQKSFEKLQPSAQIMFFVLTFAFFALFIYYFKTSLSLLSHLQYNISFTESKNPFLPKNRSLYQSGSKVTPITYKECLWQLVSCKQMGDVSYWASEAQELSEQA